MDKGVKLFGVRLNNRSDCPLAMRKSVSMGNLSGYTSPEAPSPSTPHPAQEDGYASDDFVQTSSSSGTRERKKGVPWTEDEHSLFLIGLQKLGKGDWRGISRNFVKTRTPTQVASHAQKYFLRQSNINKRRRRSSLFDMTPDKVACMTDQDMQDKDDAVTEVAETCPGSVQTLAGGNEKDADSKKISPVTGFPLPLPPSLKSDRSDQTVAKEAGQYAKAGIAEGFNAMHQPSGVPVMLFPVGIPNYDPHMFSMFSFYQWASMQAFDQQPYWPTNKNIVKPTPVIPQGPIKIDESLKISELSLDTTRPMMEPTPLSFKLLEDGSRNSAFHATSSVVSADMENQGSAISVA